jgi:hypothetical protein
MRPTSRQLSLAVLTLAAMGALASCARNEPETQTSTTTTETHTVHVNRVDLGQNITADRRVVTTDAPFNARDTVYAAVVLDPPVPTAQVTARWTAADGGVIGETTQTVAASEAEGVTQFAFAPPANLPPGTYRLDVLVDGQVQSTKEFQVH